MAVKIIDASALGAFLFGEPESDSVAARLAGSDLVAPRLLAFEIANIAVKKIRRYPAEKIAVTAALNIYSQMVIKIIDVDLAAVVRLADESKLTAYDAAYLWLARDLSAELVTLDRRLDAAAKQLAPV